MLFGTGIRYFGELIGGHVMLEDPRRGARHPGAPPPLPRATLTVARPPGHRLLGISVASRSRPFKEASLRVVRGQAECFPVVPGGFVKPVQSTQQVCVDGRKEVVTGQGLRLGKGLDDGQPRCRTIGHGDRDGPVQLDHG